jgi:hypothetical protein
VATRSKMSLTKELRMLMARLEIPVSGWTCLRTREDASANFAQWGQMKRLSAKGGCRAIARSRGKLTLVDVGRVGLLPGLGALLLLAGGRGGLLASLLLLNGGSLSSRGLAAGGGSLLGLGRHFC